MRGFTAGRDIAGPSFGLKAAGDAGTIPGPCAHPSGAPGPENGRAEGFLVVLRAVAHARGADGPLRGSHAGDRGAEGPRARLSRSRRGRSDPAIFAPSGLAPTRPRRSPIPRVGCTDREDAGVDGGCPIAGFRRAPCRVRLMESVILHVLDRRRPAISRDPPSAHSPMLAVVPGDSLGPVARAVSAGVVRRRRGPPGAYGRQGGGAAWDARA